MLAAFALSAPLAAQASFQDPGGDKTACGPGFTYGTYYSAQYIYVLRCSDMAVVAIYPR